MIIHAQHACHNTQQAMLEEALPVAIGVATALLPCMAFGGLLAVRGFMIVGAGELLSLAS